MTMSNLNQYPTFYNYAEEPCHKLLYPKIEQKLTYNENADYGAWKASVRAKFLELSGLALIEAEPTCDPALTIEYTEERDGYTETRFTFQSENGYRVPCYLLLPNGER